MLPRTHHLKNFAKDIPKPASFASAPTEEELINIFNRFDTNGDGYLSKKELESAYRMLGMSFPGLRAWRALYVADENGDGYISKKEFNKLVRKKSSK